MRAGIAAKMICIVAIRQRPASCERISRSMRSVEVAVKRRWVASAAPRVLTSVMPLTVRVSSTWLCRSASRRWRRAVMSRRMRATRRVIHTAGGMTSSESSDRRGLRATIATAVATAVVTLLAIEVAVEVMTACMPLMSWVRRDCTSPLRVRVKKAIDCRWRWRNTSVRRPCMTRSPTAVVSQVCTTPSSWVTTVTASMPPTAQRSRLTSWWGRASSMTARSRKGEAIEMTEMATMIAVTRATDRRWGPKRARTRRIGTGDSASCSRSAGSIFSGPRPPRCRGVVVSFKESLHIRSPVHNAEVTSL